MLRECGDEVSVEGALVGLPAAQLGSEILRASSIDAGPASEEVRAATRTLGRLRGPSPRTPGSASSGGSWIPDPGSRVPGPPPDPLQVSEQGGGAGEESSRIGGMRRPIAAPELQNPPSKATRASGAVGTRGTEIRGTRSSSSPFTSREGGGSAAATAKARERSGATSVALLRTKRSSSESGSSPDFGCGRRVGKGPGTRDRGPGMGEEVPGTGD